MNTEKFLSLLTALILSVAIAMGGVGCMVSGMMLEPVYLAGIARWCIFFSLAAGCCLLLLKRGGLILLAGLALVGGYLFREGTLLLQIEALLHRISQIYHKGYGWGTIQWSGAYLEDVPLDMGVGLLACIITLAVTFVLVRRKSGFWAVLVGFSPLFTCMVVTDTTPDSGWLFLLLAGLLVLILTNTVRRRNAVDGLRLTARMVVPAVLAVSLLFSLAPQDRYESQSADMQQQILSLLKGLPFVVETPNCDLILSFDGESVNTMNLFTVGPKTQLRYAVMDVVSDTTETLYLRGQSFDTYDGISWEASNNESLQNLGWPGNSQGTPGSFVSISMRSARDFRYMPYYPEPGVWRNEFERGKLTNPSMDKQYSFQCITLPEAATPLDQWVLPENGGPISNGDIFRFQSFLKLPDYSRTGAEQILAKLNFQDCITSTDYAKRIAEYVMNSAKYDLNTERMPADERDFALWFLEDSTTGYCVHFATAATVLLRAQGIPARYVTGYICNTTEGKRITVTADKSHAWVEYLDSITGCWRILDATPGYSGSGGSGGGGEDDPNEEITRPTSPVVSEPTDPSEPTTPVQDPTEETQPVQTEEPTEPETTQGTEAPTQPTGQGGIGGGGSGGNLDLSQVWSVLRPIVTVAAWVIGTCTLVFGQYLLRRKHREKQMHTGSPNKRALARWQEALRYGRILNCEPPEALEILAEKAKFSQHILMPDELLAFKTWLNQASQQLHKKPLLLRWLYKLIWAV